MVKLFQGRQRSLFGEILDWMLTPFLLLWPITFGLTWLVAEGIAKVPFDRSLQQNVNVLAQLVQSDDQHVSFQLPATAHQILHADATDTVYYQVLGAHRPAAQRSGLVRDAAAVHARAEPVPRVQLHGRGAQHEGRARRHRHRRDTQRGRILQQQQQQQQHHNNKIYQHYV